MKKERINEIWGVFFLLLGLFTFASLFFYHPEDIAFYSSHPSTPVQNYAGMIGAYLSFGLFIVFGKSAFVIPFVFLLWARCFFSQNVPERKLFKFFGLAIALLSLATIITISVKPQYRFVYGGAFGYVAGKQLLGLFGQLGSYILAGAALLLSVLLATDFLLYPLFLALSKKIRGSLDGISENLERVQKNAGKISSGMKKAQEKTEKENRQREKEREKELKEKEKLISKMPPEIANIQPKIKTYQPISVDPKQAAEKKAKEEKAEAAREEAKKRQASAPSKSEGEETPSKDKTPTPEPAETGESTLKGLIGSDPSKDAQYQLPSADLLRLPKAEKIQGDDLAANSKAIEQTLAEFGIEVKVTEVEQGPKIALYEILPAPGVRANSIAAYEDDLAMALKATSIRLIIPIPGKQTIGIEVPNSESRPIVIREMIETDEFRSKKYQLPLILGKDTSGRPMIADLTTMPHILIAGTTGSGKTVCINSIITGLLYTMTPAKLKFVMIDPKRVELPIYSEIPHMLSPVVMEAKKAPAILNWVVQEMDRRFHLLSTVGKRNIQAFNERDLSEDAKQQLAEAGDSENVIPASLPYIVVIIDELADLMLTAQDKVETAITRLAQLARAVGIHLILATQRPSVDIITGVIKANFPARVAFKVASAIDSRTILDSKGAEKLLGRGDMLFIQPGSDNMIRGQAPLIVDEEISRIVKFVSAQGKPQYHDEIVSAQNGGAGNGLGSGERDELFEDAKNIVVTSRQASTSYLQRRLGLGYTRAARIIDQLEAAGIIGPQQGAKPREILMGGSLDGIEDVEERSQEETV